MVNEQKYQSILDRYFSEVAAITEEFQDVLKEQTHALHKLVEESTEGTKSQMNNGASAMAPEDERLSPSTAKNTQPMPSGMRRSGIFNEE